MHMIDYIVIGLFALYISSAFITMVLAMIAISKGRRWAKWVAMSYVVTGLSLGLMFKMATPETTPAGVVYLAIIWPVWQAQDATGFKPPVPVWLFEVTHKR